MSIVAHLSILRQEGDMKTNTNYHMAVNMGLTQHQKQMAAIVPMYTKHGDSTRIIYVDGEECLVPQPIRRVVQNLALARGLSLSHIRNAVGDKRLPSEPLIMDVAHVFVRMKLRKGVGRDANYGYINMGTKLFVQCMKSNSEATPHTLHIGYDIAIPVLENYNKISRVICMGNRAYYEYVKRWIEDLLRWGNPQIFRLVMSLLPLYKQLEETK